ncbi:hypothetical protein A2164_01440 [Candidatus Curtissbacteria bacterium RBG_13_35_7]|uniref:Uncharacterized protein n=1 Tax=Candidatus Curtissbacteria bacterium RBG_13_35_7 TaxID=1797705 RepID=A0A1F5G1D3_9BACT|nr:MAG: hypothetical protein A2164_01440 [Candidatus Curtissbacteria bacterium RBG_13_35_7]
MLERRRPRNLTREYHIQRAIALDRGHWNWPHPRRPRTETLHSLGRPTPGRPDLRTISERVTDQLGQLVVPGLATRPKRAKRKHR